MSAKEIAAEILPEPWKSTTGDTLVEAVETLQEHGVPDEVITDTLSDVVGAMRGEYGE